ncbi:MAG: hypothetical protein ABI199_00355 [Bacteroidia bacterium]
MAAYRFRVTLEDNEDIYREIEIKSVQTFENLHEFILKSMNFDSIHAASFYMSDDYWRKGLELTNRKESSDKSKNNSPAKQMKTAKIAAYIEDPHQKIIYVYDLDDAAWSFCLELVKIITDDPKESYPKLFKSVGAAPRQYKLVVLPEEADDEEEHPSKEKIFHSEEKYDERDPSNDDLEEGDPEEKPEGEEEDFGASEFGDNEHAEEL